MQVGLPGYYHLAFFGVFLPYLAIKSSLRLATRPYPPKVNYFNSQVLILSIFLAISFFIGQREWVIVFPREMPEPRMFVLGAAVLVALVLGLAWLAPRGQPELAWLVYTLVAVGSLKLLLQDVRVGRPPMLVASLGLYGSLLILVPRLLKARGRAG